MKKNIGKNERVLRLVVGTIGLSMAFWGPRNKWFLSFVIPALTGITGVSPIYSMLGVSTIPKRSESKTKEVEKQANEYFPEQSDSEIAAGHPLVGVS